MYIYMYIYNLHCKMQAAQPLGSTNSGPKLQGCHPTILNSNTVTTHEGDPKACGRQATNFASPITHHPLTSHHPPSPQLQQAWRGPRHSQQTSATSCVFRLSDSAWPGSLLEP